MKRFRVAAATLLAVIIACTLPGFAADDIVIDVVDGNFRSGQYNIPLIDDPTPITISMVDGNVMLEILTSFGAMELNMGSGRVILTERASQYVKVGKSSSGTGEGIQPSGTGPCPACGNPLLSGDHRHFACGHYACKAGTGHRGRYCSSCGHYTCDGGDHSLCERCGVARCVHVDLECPYARNPAPTPFSTKTPEGETLYHYVDPAGEYVIGLPVKPSEWAPGLEYARKHATPTPTVSPYPY